MSRIALITDIHANREAFAAVLEHAKAQGADAYALLGDLVGYGGDPAWVVDQALALRAQGAALVQGNHDRAVAQGPLPSMHEDARQMIVWTRSRLSAAQIEALAALPMSQTRGDCLFVHANAFDPAGFAYIQGRLEAVRSLQATECSYSFCGHVHEPMLYHLSSTGKAGDFCPEPGVPIPLLPHRRWLVIPGSCGQPRDGNPAACYALFDDGRQELVFHRVPYDHEAAARRLLDASDLPAELAQRLAQRLRAGE